MNILHFLKRKQKISQKEKREVVGDEILRICKLNDSLTDSVDLPAFKRAQIALALIEKHNALDFFFENKELLKKIA